MAVEEDPEAPADGPAGDSQLRGGDGRGLRERVPRAPPGGPPGPCTYPARPGGRPLAAWSRFGEGGRPERGARGRPAGGRRGPGEGEAERLSVRLGLPNFAERLGELGGKLRVLGCWRAGVLGCCGAERRSPGCSRGADRVPREAGPARSGPGEDCAGREGDTAHFCKAGEDRPAGERAGCSASAHGFKAWERTPRGHPEGAGLPAAPPLGRDWRRAAPPIRGGNQLISGDSFPASGTPVLQGWP